MYLCVLLQGTTTFNKQKQKFILKMRYFEINIIHNLHFEKLFGSTSDMKNCSVSGRRQVNQSSSLAWKTNKKDSRGVSSEKPLAGLVKARRKICVPPKIEKHFIPDRIAIFIHINLFGSFKLVLKLIFRGYGALQVLKGQWTLCSSGSNWHSVLF